MAYLALNNLVDAVLTEDSDLLCYGCPTVGAFAGAYVGQAFAFADLGNALSCPLPDLLSLVSSAMQVFFKMDKGGEGEEVRLADLPAAKELAFQVGAPVAGTLAAHATASFAALPRSDAMPARTS